MSEAGKFDFVFDSNALIAHLENESGAARVKEVLEQAERGECTIGFSIINLGEVVYLVERERGLAKAHEVLAVIHSLPIALLPVDEAAVLAAAHIKANYRISYPDAFAAAAAQIYQATLLTGDPEFRTLEEGLIQIEWLSSKD